MPGSHLFTKKDLCPQYSSANNGRGVKYAVCTISPFSSSFTFNRTLKGGGWRLSATWSLSVFWETVESGFSYCDAENKIWCSFGNREVTGVCGTCNYYFSFLERNWNQENNSQLSSFCIFAQCIHQPRLLQWMYATHWAMFWDTFEPQSDQTLSLYNCRECRCYTKRHTSHGLLSIWGSPQKPRLLWESSMLVRESFSEHMILSQNHAWHWLIVYLIWLIKEIE